MSDTSGAENIFSCSLAEICLTLVQRSSPALSNPHTTRHNTTLRRTHTSVSTRRLTQRPPRLPQLCPPSILSPFFLQLRVSESRQPVVVTNPSLPLPSVRVNIYWPSLSVWLALGLPCPAVHGHTHTHTHTHTHWDFSFTLVHHQRAVSEMTWAEQRLRYFRSICVEVFVCVWECVFNSRFVYFWMCVCVCVRVCAWERVMGMMIVTGLIVYSRLVCVDVQ